MGDEEKNGSPVTRWEGLLVVAMLCAMLLQCLLAMPLLAPTFDEFAHLPAGYTYLKRGNFEFYKHNPPLFQMIMAMPVLVLDPALPDEASTLDYTRWEYARAFHALNREEFDRLFYYARLPTVLLSLAMAWVVWRWCRRWYGRAGGLLGMSLVVFNPFIIANAQLATVDVGTGFLVALLFWFLARYLHERKWGLLLLVGLMMGLCQAAKFSSLLLYGIVPLIMLLAVMWPALSHPDGKWKKKIPLPSWQVEGLVPLALHCLIIFVISWVVVCAVFGFDRIFEPFGDFPFVSDQMKSLQEIELLQDLPVPLPHYYLEGLDAQNDLNHRSFAVYLLGERSQTGFKSFFLIAFLAKMTLGFLFLFLLAIPIWGHAFLRRRDLRWLFLLIPVGVYGCYFSFMIVVQSGLRYLIPMLPLVAVFAAVTGKALWHKGKLGKAVLLAPVLVNLYSCLFIYPDYLCYFNEAWGGPKQGHKVIVATDLDWGQDLKRFKDYVAEHPMDEVQTDVFGEMDAETYGIPHARDMDKFPSPGWRIISIQNVINAFVPVPDKSWLKNFKPVEKFGYTLRLYHHTEGDLKKYFTENQYRAYQIANEADRMRETDPDEAERLLLEAIALYPESWQIHHFLAQLYYDRKQLKKADKYVRETLRLNPKGEVYILLEKNERAE